MSKTNPRITKKEPDFSTCRDPEFAKAEYEYIQILLEQARNNPFLKLYKKPRHKK